MNSSSYVGVSPIRESCKAIPEGMIWSTPWYHWNVFLNNTVYEVTGASPQEIQVYPSTEAEYLKKNSIYKVELRDIGAVSDKELRLFMEAWREKHPVYLLFGFNCQLFAKDFAENFLAFLWKLNSMAMRVLWFLYTTGVFLCTQRFTQSFVK